MNYLNIHTDFLRSETYLGSEPIERATWLNLMSWCATQENGGVIENAESWTDRKWQQLCGITLSEVETISLLYGFEDGNLVVSNYPVDKEAEVKAKRKAGKKGGRPKKTASTQPLVNKDFKPHGSTMLKVNDNHQAETVKTERNGREWKGMERKENNIASSSCPISSNDSDWELIWKNSLKVSRERSSRVKTEKAWKAIKANERPDILDVLNALEAWKASEKWQGGFAEGIHIWIKDKQWLNIPEAHDQKEQPVQRRSAV